MHFVNISMGSQSVQLTAYNKMVIFSCWMKVHSRLNILKIEIYIVKTRSECIHICRYFYLSSHMFFCLFWLLFKLVFDNRT